MPYGREWCISRQLYPSPDIVIVTYRVRTFNEHLLCHRFTVDRLASANRILYTVLAKRRSVFVKVPKKSESSRTPQRVVWFFHFSELLVPMTWGLFSSGSRYRLNQDLRWRRVRYEVTLVRVGGKTKINIFHRVTGLSRSLDTRLLRCRRTNTVVWWIEGKKDH